MKFTVSSSALLTLLSTTGKVISNKNTLPILDYFLLELKGNELTVTTSDLETTLVGHISVDNVEREGVIAAPAKLMLDSLKEFPEMPLEFDVNDTTWDIRLDPNPVDQRFWTTTSNTIAEMKPEEFEIMIKKAEERFPEETRALNLREQYKKEWQEYAKSRTSQKSVSHTESTPKPKTYT